MRFYVGRETLRYWGTWVMRDEVVSFTDSMIVLRNCNADYVLQHCIKDYNWLPYSRLAMLLMRFDALG